MGGDDDDVVCITLHTNSSIDWKGGGMEGCILLTLRINARNEQIEISR